MFRKKIWLGNLGTRKTVLVELFVFSSFQLQTLNFAKRSGPLRSFVGNLPNVSISFFSKNFFKAASTMHHE